MRWRAIWRSTTKPALWRDTGVCLRSVARREAIAINAWVRPPRGVRLQGGYVAEDPWIRPASRSARIRRLFAAKTLRIHADRESDLFLRLDGAICPAEMDKLSMGIRNLTCQSQAGSARLAENRKVAGRSRPLVPSCSAQSRPASGSVSSFFTYKAREWHTPPIEPTRNQGAIHSESTLLRVPRRRPSETLQPNRRFATTAMPALDHCDRCFAFSSHAGEPDDRVAVTL